MCLCHQAVQFGIGEMWEVNGRTTQDTGPVLLVLSGAVLGMPEGNGGAIEADGAQLTTDKLASAILVMQEHILLLKYRRAELHLGVRQLKDF